MTTKRLTYLATLFTSFLARPTTSSTALARNASIATLGSVNLFRMSSTAIPESQRTMYKSDADWRQQLDSEEYRVLRNKGTEMAGSGEYDKHYPKQGVYVCRGCQTPLYTAKDKFNSGCGWPAFDNGFKGAIERHTDVSFGMERTEIVCKACGGHLGHVFKGEKFTPTNERHCVNSLSIKFDPEGSMEGAKDF